MGASLLAFSRLFGVFALVVSATACASVVHGPTQVVPVSSDPDGAAVTVDCGRELDTPRVTPMRARLDRRAEKCILSLQLDGYEPERVTLERGFSPWYWGNFTGVALIPIGLSDGGPGLGNGEAVLGLAVTGLAGLLVDHFRGAQYRLEPASVHVVLRRKVP
jgi:hypothetical protein